MVTLSPSALLGHKQVPLPKSALVQAEPGWDGSRQVLPDVAYERLALVNVIYCGFPDAGDGRWLLVDAGLPGFSHAILRTARRRFGGTGRPDAVILTHGHVDHVGALGALLAHWRVPVFAHERELPFLTGRAAYAPPDPTVGGGALAFAGGLFPSGPFDFRPWVRPLPADGSVPGMPGWRWLATPGHTPGHVSLWRESDRTLIAGDAFITTAQESALAVLSQRPEVHGPPMYFTPDWRSARQSVELLAALKPETVVTGHGRAVRGPELRDALARLAEHFDRLAVPRHATRSAQPAPGAGAAL